MSPDSDKKRMHGINNRLKNCVLLAFCCIAFVNSGCGNTAAVDMSIEQTTLRTLGRLYGRFMASHRGQPPTNEKVFKEYVLSKWKGNQDESDGEGKSAKESMEELFLSPRDGNKMAVMYGESVVLSDGQPFIAYEAETTEGMRFVVNAAGAVIEMNAEDFHATFPDSQ